MTPPLALQAVLTCQHVVHATDAYTCWQNVDDDAEQVLASPTHCSMLSSGTGIMDVGFPSSACTLQCNAEMIDFGTCMHTLVCTAVHSVIGTYDNSTCC